MPEHGWTDDGLQPYVPGIPCMECGQFVGRNGSIEVEYFEMSTTVASVEGTCARCLAKVCPDCHGARTVTRPRGVGVVTSPCESCATPGRKQNSAGRNEPSQNFPQGGARS